MPRPILILQLRPEDETADEEYRAFLRYGRLDPADTVRLRIERSGIPYSLDLDDYSAIIVGGSPFDISTPEAGKRSIQKRIEADFHRLLGQVVARDFPFLGACSGNGLLGAFLGAPISRRYGEPVGCFPVHLTEAGRTDPLLAGMPETIEVLLGHKEACDELPRGATLLIRGEACPVQMFRVGENVYATQFHPEGDAEGFITRIRVYRHHGYFEPEEADALIERIRHADTPHAREILARFVRRYLHR
ncbi:MAG: glutamine amidotransferase [Gammaproteobacteria bacterium]|nr:MAG: glutamine amidotransferase [Gammaproteobacteria bacterium]